MEEVLESNWMLLVVLVGMAALIIEGNFARRPNGSERRIAVWANRVIYVLGFLLVAGLSVMWAVVYFRLGQMGWEWVIDLTYQQRLIWIALAIGVFFLVRRHRAKTR